MQEHFCVYFKIKPGKNRLPKILFKFKGVVYYILYSPTKNSNVKKTSRNQVETGEQ